MVEFFMCTALVFSYVLMVAGVFCTLLGMITLLHWIKTPVVPSDDSNRINNIKSWWIGMTRPEVLAASYKSFRQDVMDNVDDVEFKREHDEFLRALDKGYKEGGIMEDKTRDNIITELQQRCKAMKLNEQQSLEYCAHTLGILISSIMEVVESETLRCDYEDKVLICELYTEEEIREFEDNDMDSNTDKPILH